MNDSVEWTGVNDGVVRAFCGSTLSPECWSDRPAFEVIDPGKVALVWSEGNWHRIRPGDAIIANPRPDDPDGPWTELWIKRGERYAASGSGRP